MSVISNEMRFLGVNSSLVNLIEKKDSTNNEKTEYYSLDDIRGYKVYTALLTQSGGDDLQAYYGGESLTIGATYEITQIDDGDFTNVGAPNNNLGTYFVATGTTPNWGTFGENVLEYNTGAPVVTVLENTLGYNITYSYSIEGQYSIILQNTPFSNIILPTVYLKIDVGVGREIYIRPEDDNLITVITQNEGTNEDNILTAQFIEIRVYN